MKNQHPHKSEMMDKLYGEKISQVVYNLCQELNPEFNKLVQEIVYDVFWNRDGISLKDKSLITIISLIILDKEEQLRIPLSGFFNLGGVPEFMSEIIQYMVRKTYIRSPDQAIGILKEMADKASFETIEIPIKIKAMVDFVCRIAIGNNEKTKICMKQLLKDDIFSEKEIENIMIHQLVYCGFPCAMNGFAVLKNISNRNEI